MDESGSLTSDYPTKLQLFSYFWPIGILWKVLYLTFPMHMENIDGSSWYFSLGLLSSLLNHSHKILGWVSTHD